MLGLHEIPSQDLLAGKEFMQSAMEEELEMKPDCSFSKALGGFVATNEQKTVDPANAVHLAISPDKTPAKLPTRIDIRAEKS